MVKDPYQWTPHRGGILKGTHQGNGTTRWRVRYRPHPGAAQTSRTFNTLDEARNFRITVEEQRQRQRHGIEATSPRHTPPFGRYMLDRYLPRFSNQRTATNYRTVYQQIRKVHPEFLEIPIGLIKQGDVEILLARHEHAGYAGSTTNLLRRTITAVLHHAVDNQLIAQPTIKTQRRREQRSQQPPSTGELHRLLEAIDPRYHAPILVAASTGLRSGELRALTTHDIDGLAFNLTRNWHVAQQPAHHIHVRRQLDDNNQPAIPKTQAAQRTILVLPDTINVIASHLNQWGTGRNNLLWANAQGDPIDAATLRRKLNTAARTTCGRTIKVHSLRRYYGTALIYAGVPLHEIQRLMGHTTPTMTMRLYLEVQTDLADLNNRLRQSFGALFTHTSGVTTAS